MEDKIKLNTIDCDLFIKYFHKFKGKLTNKANCDIEKSLHHNSAYSKSPITFNRSLLEISKINDSVLELTDLYPVNICIIDFLLKEFKEKNIGEEFKLLDFACGIPNLLYHLHLIGFKDLYGYDNWKQLEKKYADEFVKNSEIGEVFITHDEIKTKDITALSHAGYFLPLNEYENILSISTLKYFFADYRFFPKASLIRLPDVKITPFEQRLVSWGEDEITKHGFKLDTIYDGLLLIYKRESVVEQEINQ